MTRQALREQRSIGRTAYDRAVHGRYAVAISVLALAVSFMFFAENARHVLRHPYDLRYETVLLDQAERTLGEVGLYPPFEEPPYVIDNYPPVFPLLMKWIPTPDWGPLIGGRLISMLAALGSAALVALIVRREAGDAPALLAAAVLLGQSEFQTFAMVARVDMLGLFFGLAGFLAFTSSGSRMRWLGVACIVLGVYTRHSMLLFPVAASIFLVLREGPASLRWPLTTLAIGIAVFLVGYLWTGGGLYEHLIHFNQLPFRMGDIASKWLHQIRWWHVPLWAAVFLTFLPRDPVRTPWLRRLAYGVLCGVALVAQALAQSAEITDMSEQRAAEMFAEITVPQLWCVGALVVILVVALGQWKRFEERERLGPSACAFLVLLGLGSALLIGRAGSDVNYLLEHLTTLVIVATVGLGWTPGRSRWVLVGLLILSLAGHWVGSWPHRDTRPRVLAGMNAAFQSLKKTLSGCDGPILCEAPEVQLLTGQPLYYSTFMYRYLTDEGQWDPEPLLRDIREQRFAAVVRYGWGPPLRPNVSVRIYAKAFPDPVHEELLRHYEPLKGSLEQYLKSEGTDPGWALDPSHLVDFTKEGLAERFMVWVPK